MACDIVSARFTAGHFLSSSAARGWSPATPGKEQARWRPYGAGQSSGQRAEVVNWPLMSRVTTPSLVEGSLNHCKFTRYFLVTVRN